MVETMSRSVLTKNQKKTFRKDFLDDSGRPAAIIVEIRYDDKCGNGHNTFSIIGEIYNRNYVQGEETITSTIKSGGKSSLLWLNSCGCIHDEIVKYFPEFSNLIKFHLCSSDGPSHYVANTLYHAGNRDHWGLLKDEKRQIVNGKSGLPAWKLMAISAEGQEIELYKLRDSVDSQFKPECPYTLEYRPWCHIGEGKERELEAARNAAIWPEATDEELTAPNLKDKLIERLPALMKDFKEMVESLGFIY